MAERRAALPLWPKEGRRGKELSLEEEGENPAMEVCFFSELAALCAECEIFVGRVLERRGKVVADRREREGSKESEKTPGSLVPIIVSINPCSPGGVLGGRQEAGGAWKPLSDCRYIAAQEPTGEPGGGSPLTANINMLRSTNSGVFL